MVLGMFFWASIISAIGPSFLTFGHFNIPRVLEGPHMVSRGKWGGPNRPHDAHDAGSWGMLGPQNA